MRNRTVAISIMGGLLAAALLAWAYRSWRTVEQDPVLNLLSQLPANADTVVYLNAEQLRQSPFLAQLYKWAPQPAADPDYSEFVQATGFNYERDLGRLGLAISNSGKQTAVFAVADGRFDRTRISAYASRGGTRATRNGRDVFSVPISGGTNGAIDFTFLRNDRIALTNGSAFDSPSASISADANDWSERFRRLSGSPIFAVIKQGRSGNSLGDRAPGGFQSPQLAALIDQLQWITVAGKPEGDRLRVVLEAEGSAQTNTRQLSDLINGLLTFAESGLNDQKVRQQLQPQVRESYLEVLRSAEVSRIDRGETKSVRLIFAITPSFLDAARLALPGPAPAPATKPFPNKRTFRN